jgi:hypothetical protein
MDIVIIKLYATQNSMANAVHKNPKLENICTPNSSMPSFPFLIKKKKAGL